jgi:hypothetical protein
VTKETLFQTVWFDTVVSDDALTSCIQELRSALRDNSKQPRYIETVHRRGYRFLPAVTTRPVVSSQFSIVSTGKAPLQNPQLATGHWQLTTKLVGRETELRQLHDWLDKALGGERQLVFVSGEPGIGKTTLVEAFLAGIGQRGPGNGGRENQKAKAKTQKSKVKNPAPSTQHRAPGMWLGWGQCIEHYGAGEAYLPILEALGRLCREKDGKKVIALLRQHAPSWLVQMQALLSSTELDELQRRTAGVTRERMLRELAEALEVVTQEHPLVLTLEDLHWSDVSTLDLLSMLARRQEPARLLVIGTYRPVEVLTREHPLKALKQELQLHGRCEELALDFLSEDDVAEYLAVRFAVPSPLAGEGQDRGALRSRHGQRPSHPVPLPQGEREPFVAESVHNLARYVHRRTDGNPLFMVHVTN